MTPPADAPVTRYCAECGRPAAADEMARFGDVLVCPDCKNHYAQKLREGVAPVAAVPYAGFWVRVVAWLIDFIILLVVGSIVQFALGGSLINPQIDPNARPEDVLGPLMGKLGLIFLINTVIQACYEAFFTSSALSATPGKLALSLKVLRPDGSRIGLGRAFGRHFAKFISAIILGIGYILVAFDAQKRGLHDMICDTRVVVKPQS